MSATVERPSQPVKVYATAMVVLSAERILTVIKQLHVCYDYCAAWKQPPRD